MADPEPLTFKPHRRATHGAPSVFLWHDPPPGLLAQHSAGCAALKVTKTTLVKAIKRVKKIQKLFSPFDCYLLVTFVKNITSIFEKRSFSSYNMEK